LHEGRFTKAEFAAMRKILCANSAIEFSGIEMPKFFTACSKVHREPLAGPKLVPTVDPRIAGGGEAYVPVKIICMSPAKLAVVLWLDMR
jgi:hypothetical protein